MINSYPGHLPTYLFFLVDFLGKTNLPTFFNFWANLQDTRFLVTVGRTPGVELGQKVFDFLGGFGSRKSHQKVTKKSLFISLFASFQYSILLQKSIQFSSFQYSSFPSFPSFQCHRQQGSRTKEVPSFLVLQFLVFYQSNQLFQYSSFLVFSTTSSQFFSTLVPSFLLV